MFTKQYIGNGVYVDIDSYGMVRITTEDGESVTNTIYLEDLTDVKRMATVLNNILAMVEGDES